tara:strand:- start:323 stop:601 length:279 start_codon:yes stop_codon:yes gene_type:complete
MFGLGSKKIKKFCDSCEKVLKHEYVLDSKTKIAKGRFEGYFWDLFFFCDVFEIIQKRSNWHFFYKDKCQTCGLETEVRELGTMGPDLPPRVG